MKKLFAEFVIIFTSFGVFAPSMADASIPHSHHHTTTHYSQVTHQKITVKGNRTIITRDICNGPEECWTWKVNISSVSNDWSEVKWTVNGLGWEIQDRSLCATGSGNLRYVKSGTTSRTGKWVLASCNSSENILRAFKRAKASPKPWQKWFKYWTRPTDIKQ